MDELARRGGRLDVVNRGPVRVRRADIRQEVTCGVGAVGDEGEYFADEALLHCSLELSVELGQSWLAGIVEDEHGIDHDRGGGGGGGW